MTDPAGPRYEVIDILLKSVEAKLHRAAARIPLTPKWDVVPAVVYAGDGGVVLLITYKMTADDQHHHILDLAVTFAVVTRWAEDPYHEEVEAEVGQLLRVVEPHLREFVHNFTLLMGLPPLIIDIGRTPTPAMSPA